MFFPSMRGRRTTNKATPDTTIAIAMDTSVIATSYAIPIGR